MTRSKVYTFEPVGVDLFDPRPNQPMPGTPVVIFQPTGCPRNGTFGFVYVKDAIAGTFYGLVRKASLVATKEYVVPRDLAAEARDNRGRSA